jgi:hypothetical protein
VGYLQCFSYSPKNGQISVFTVVPEWFWHKLNYFSFCWFLKSYLLFVAKVL